jgi:hypothetical protein
VVHIFSVFRDKKRDAFNASPNILYSSIKHIGYRPPRFTVPDSFCLSVELFEVLLLLLLAFRLVLPVELFCSCVLTEEERRVLLRVLLPAGCVVFPEVVDLTVPEEVDLRWVVVPVDGPVPEGVDDCPLLFLTSVCCVPEVERLTLDPVLPVLVVERTPVDDPSPETVLRVPPVEVP